MNYGCGRSGRIEAEASTCGSVASEASFWTYERVEERLVETMRCWWRMPGGGRWPFAGDGPWHLARRENTPFDEAKMTGRVVRTIVAGRTAYEYA
mgnify:CR=1 FL=1